MPHAMDATAVGWQGVVNLTKLNMEQLRRTYPRTALEGLRRGAKIILDKALYYCPEDTGFLRQSGDTEVNDLGDDGGEVVVFFSAYYAVFVHENTRVRHDPPTQAKFLERAVRDTYNQVTWVMRTSFRNVMASPLYGGYGGGFRTKMPKVRKRKSRAKDRTGRGEGRGNIASLLKALAKKKNPPKSMRD